MTKLLATIVVISAHCTSFAQVLLPSRHQPVPGSISYVQAANKARAFMELLNLSPGDLASYKVILQKRSGQAERREWRVYLPSARIKIDSQSSVVTSYNNTKREDDRYRNRGRTGAKFTTSDSAAKRYLRELATRLGVPAGAQMTGYAMKGDGEGQDTNPLGSFGCVFKDSAGQIIATLACDLQDGTVLYYSRSR